MNNDKIYARVANGRIIEFPVLNHLVTEEDLASGSVKEVQDNGTNLAEDKFHRVIKELEMVKGIPTFVYSSILLTAREFVQKNYIDLLSDYFHLPRLTAQTIPLDIVYKMAEAVKDLGTLELDRFAQSRGYDNIVSVVSYRGDPSPRFAAEAERAIILRSQYWSNLTDFNEKVTSGEIEFPRTIEGITSMFPTLTWN